jgi:ribonuclease P protein component
MSLSARPDDYQVIKKRKEIKKILQNGHRIKTRFGNFYLMKGEQGVTRMAVLIKKHVGNAVQRNYCKRIVRSYIRNTAHRFKQYNDIIFLYTFTGDVTYQDLYEEFSDRLALK